ncbi:MAG: hypothetical protein AVDCRST_MAG59-5272, partial [uncultured Thermomicrobiales bacterium]
GRVGRAGRDRGGAGVLRGRTGAGLPRRGDLRPAAAGNGRDPRAGAGTVATRHGRLGRGVGPRRRCLPRPLRRRRRLPGGGGRPPAERVSRGRPGRRGAAGSRRGRRPGRRVHLGPLPRPGGRGGARGADPAGGVRRPRRRHRAGHRSRRLQPDPVPGRGDGRPRRGRRGGSPAWGSGAGRCHPRRPLRPPRGAPGRHRLPRLPRLQAPALPPRRGLPDRAAGAVAGVAAVVRQLALGGAPLRRVLRRPAGAAPERRPLRRLARLARLGRRPSFPRSDPAVAAVGGAGGAAGAGAAARRRAGAAAAERLDRRPGDGRRGRGRGRAPGCLGARRGAGRPGPPLNPRLEHARGDRPSRRGRRRGAGGAV